MRNGVDEIHFPVYNKLYENQNIFLPERSLKKLWFYGLYRLGTNHGGDPLGGNLDLRVPPYDQNMGPRGVGINHGGAPLGGNTKATAPFILAWVGKYVFRALIQYKDVVLPV